MTYFADGSRYCFLADSEEGEGTNVGWLAAEHPFPTGPCTEGFVSALAKLISSPANRTKGFHYCDLCSPEASRGSIRTTIEGQNLELGDAEVWVASATGPRFAAPTLILHYVVAHAYRPPEGFQRAVIAAAGRSVE
jgi:hypothetical protein